VVDEEPPGGVAILPAHSKENIALQLVVDCDVWTPMK
jgi:hypothetical protein